MNKIKNLSPDYSKLINEGGYGDIYKCKHHNDILVKITKNIDDHKYIGETNKKIINKIKKHDSLMNIIGVDSTKYNNIHLIYIEYVNGINLSDYIIKYIFNDTLIIDVIYQILKGLEFLHNNKITHRDIKLDNIIIDPTNNKIKIIDFGLAFYGLPCNGLVGTSGFFAPEMIFNPDSYSSKCDIWSLGCVLYYMVCKYHPFYSSHNREYYIQQLKDHVTIPYENDKWNNKLLYTLSNNMLVYNDNNRFSAKQCIQFINSNN